MKNDVGEFNFYADLKLFYQQLSNFPQFHEHIKLNCHCTVRARIVVKLNRLNLSSVNLKDNAFDKKLILCERESTFYDKAIQMMLAHLLNIMIFFQITLTGYTL